IVWLDRAGHRAGPATPATRYGHPTFSPDGRFGIFELDDARGMTQNLLKFDVQRGETTVLGAIGSLPVHARDGSSVSYVCRSGDRPAFCAKTPGGGGAERVLWEAGDGKSPNSLSPDGRFLSFTDVNQIFILPMTGDRTPYALYPDKSTQRHG